MVDKYCTPEEIKALKQRTDGLILWYNDAMSRANDGVTGIEGDVRYFEHEPAR